jgi:hypothetical protein
MAKKGRSLTKVVWPSASSGPLPRHVAKIGRNEPCPCGSGKKYKDCHQKEGEAFLRKLAKQEEREHRKEVREKLKRKGVPWWKRMFMVR